MIVEILTIGDEILSGDILDTNTQYLAERCWANGFRVEYHTAVRDEEDKISAALKNAAGRADVIFCTGGLGPTADDFTVEVAAKTFGRKLVRHAEALEVLEKRYAERGIELSDNNRKQADIPEGGTVFINKMGTAPGSHYCHQGRHFYFMPGVPKEMKYLFEEHVLPHVLQNSQEMKKTVATVYKTFGRRESDLDADLKDLLTGRSDIQGVRLGFRVAFPEIFLKLSVRDSDESIAQARLATVESEIEKRVGRWIYAKGRDATMEGEVIRRLKQAGKRLALAESCTGGLMASRITDVPGASSVFLGGVVSYDNAVKHRVLGVSDNILNEHGAVSAECAEAMVRGVHKITGAEYCASVTGIAGPEGGTPEKPVGTVWVATLFENDLKVKNYFFPLPRDMFKRFVTGVVFNRILGHLS